MKFLKKPHVAERLDIPPDGLRGDGKLLGKSINTHISLTRNSFNDPYMSRRHKIFIVIQFFVDHNSSHLRQIVLWKYFNISQIVKGSD
jgi:hypothetical protein